MFVGATNVGQTEYLLRILETEYKNHFEFIVIMCPTILDNNKTYLSKKWIFDDKNFFLVWRGRKIKGLDQIIYKTH